MRDYDLFFLEMYKRELKAMLIKVKKLKSTWEYDPINVPRLTTEEVQELQKLYSKLGASGKDMFEPGSRGDELVKKRIAWSDAFSKQRKPSSPDIIDKSMEEAVKIEVRVIPRLREYIYFEEKRLGINKTQLHPVFKAGKSE